MRILIAEDHASLARTLAEGLREEGFAADLTFDGREALKMARTSVYDCLILDIMLPGCDGWKIIAALRSAGVQTPILCLTARDQIEDRVRGLNLGADDYLVKPFAFAELAARVRTLVRRGYQQRSPVMRVGDLEIDTAARTAARAGRPLKLSASEFKLLAYLAHRQGEVVPRSDILDHLYDAVDEVSSNVVDVYIAYLRNKIDRGATVKLIHTRYGEGYVLTADHA